MSDAITYNEAQLQAGKLTTRHITTLAEQWQRSNGLEPVDGKAGPATIASIDAYLEAEQPAPPVDSTSAGELAAAAAERLWKLDIIDPPFGSKHPRASASLAVINEIIATNGWGDNTTYRGNGPPQWCGMFAGKCWVEAGLDPSWLAAYFASTYRLGLWARYKRFSPTSKANPPPVTEAPTRLIGKLDPGKAPPFLPQKGDIVIVGDGEPDEGDHVTIAVGYGATMRTFDTISGNGGGVGPNGDRREGISRREYSIDARSGYRAMWLIRPAAGDLLRR